MRAIKNIFVGFLVSFIGSIPLGYLNLVGFEIYSKLGTSSLLLFLFGVLVVEMFVIHFTLLFAKQLVSNKKLMKVIDFFAIFFLLILACTFYFSGNTSLNSPSVLEKYAAFSPFLIGLGLSAINFVQVPFWTGWNLYLMNGNYITVAKKLKLYYIAGTLAGTFAGMLALILLLSVLAQRTTSFSTFVVPVLFPLFFVVLALFQIIKVYKKYFSKKMPS